MKYIVKSACMVGMLLAAGLAHRADAAALPGLNVDLTQTSVSGVSSGGYMAVQFAVAYSETVVGSGIFAGGPYRCATSLSQALGSCTLGTPDVARAVAETERAAAAGQIDAPSNLARQRVWLFSGSNDGVVKRPVTDALQAYFARFTPAYLIFYQDTYAAGHALVTERFGGACDATGQPFINDCDYDAAGKLLQHIYGRLAAPDEASLSGEILPFDQRGFLPDRAVSMASEGYVYVPADCSTGARCRVHIVFHGCRQSAETLDHRFYRHAGYNAWADHNRIVVLYPQAAPSAVEPFNPKGCWDWWGYTGADFAFRQGAQPAAVRAMLQQLAAGTGAEPRPDSVPAPQLVVTDAADDAASLAWFESIGATGYHVERATTEAGPFERLTATPLTMTSYADTGLSPNSRYVYRVTALAPAGGGTRSNLAHAETRAPPPPCDPYFSDNATHVAHGRAWAFWGLTLARGSWDFMGLWNTLSETALYREGDDYHVGVCAAR